MLKKIFTILGLKRKKKIIKLQALIIASSILELIGVTLIIPFMSIVNKQVTMEKNEYLASISSFFHIENYHELVVFLGFLVLFFMIFSSLSSVCTLKKITFEAHKMGIELSNEMFLSYLKRPWTEHLSYRSSRIINITNNQTNSLVGGVLIPLLNLNSKVILILLFSLMLLLVNPLVTFISISLFLSMYGVIFLILKNKLSSNSIIINRAYQERIKVLNEVSCSIKDIVLKKLEGEFHQEFESVTRALPIAAAKNAIYASSPRYMVEMIAYVGVISMILILFIFQSQSLEDSISLLFLFALSALKLLPAAQQVYAAISQIRGNVATIDILYSEVKSSNVNNNKEEMQVKAYGFYKLSIKNISFTYPDKDEKVIKNISLSFYRGQSIAFVGPSGSGKSTLIDMILGLLPPQRGEIVVYLQDKKQLKPSQISSLIGYVPQSINILDRTVAENVAFGVPKDDIDYEKVENALEIAQCEFVYDLENGFKTVLGERGIELSGGQRQRIAIARSMYHVPEILIFDEATSALDGQTEKAIIQVVNNLPKDMTKVMIAHRLTTVKNCDVIYFLEKGRIVDQGTYDELYQRNNKFKMMAI